MQGDKSISLAMPVVIRKMLEFRSEVSRILTFSEWRMIDMNYLYQDQMKKKNSYTVFSQTIQIYSYNTFITTVHVEADFAYFKFVQRSSLFTTALSI